MTTKQLVYTALMTAIIAILGMVPVIPYHFLQYQLYFKTLVFS
ncbi:bioY family domain protein [Staphylococcus aureus subsp. aureus SA5211]|nr:bioY family domain protein [Staphylococcus aureus subsp. aureus SA5211]